MTFSPEARQAAVEGRRLARTAVTVRTAPDEPWMARDDLGCLTVQPELFFGTNYGDEVREACASCPALEQCQRAALRIPDLSGFYGGMSKEDRAEARGMPRGRPRRGVS